MIDQKRLMRTKKLEKISEQKMEEEVEEGMLRPSHFEKLSGMEKKQYEILFKQIWELFPAFTKESK